MLLICLYLIQLGDTLNEINMEASQCITVIRCTRVLSRGVSYISVQDALTWIYVDPSKVGHLNGSNGGISVASMYKMYRECIREEYPHECDALTWIYVVSKAGHLNGSNGGISVHPV